MIRIKCASGFGDAIYMYPVAKHFIEQGEKDITLMTNYSDIFKALPVKTIHHTKDWATHKISYCGNKYKAGTSQFQDVCLAAGVPTDLEFKVDWSLRNKDLIENIRKMATRKGRRILVVAGPDKPFGRDDEFGIELTIDFKRYDDLLSRIHQDWYIVQICKQQPIHKLKYLDVNLMGKTTPSDVMDLISIADRTMGQVGHILPISECLGTPGLIWFSRSGLNCENRFINSIKPEKVIHYRDTMLHVIDDWSTDKLLKVWDAIP